MPDKKKKYKKYGNTYLFLVAIPIDSPLLPLNSDFPSLSSEVPYGLLTRRIPKAHTSHTGLKFPSLFDVRFQSSIDFSEILGTLLLFSSGLGLPDMARTLFVIKKTPLEHELHSTYETTSYIRFDEDLVRLTPYTHSSPPRIQDHTSLITPNYSFPVFYNPVLVP